MSGKKGSKLQRRARRPMVEEIEPRILYSADFAPGLIPESGLVTDAEQRSVEPGGEFQHAASAQLQTRRHELVFVDPATPDYQKLIENIRTQGGERDIQVVLLDAGKDGIRQISQTLAGREEVSAIHIVSHGSDGSVQLGKSSLDFDSLLKNGSKIKGWGDALGADADILIYGCEVAQSDAGRSLIEALARLTGADVAASDDLTGHAELGGDWNLEVHTGQIGTSIVFSRSVVLDWRATLQASAVGTETRVNATTGGVQKAGPLDARSVAMAADGSYVVAWSGEGPGDGAGTGGGVFFQRYDANGAPQGGETRVNTTTAGAQTRPSIAMDSSGNFVVAYTSNGQDGSGWGGYARRFAADGTALDASEFQVNGSIAGDQQDLAVAVNASGAFVITWTDTSGLDGSGAGVYAQRYDAAGAAQGGNFQVNQTTTANQWNDGHAIDSAGNFIVTWASDDGGSFGVYFRRYDANGNALSGETLANTTTAGAQDESTVALDASGNFTIVWRSAGQDGSGTGIYGRRYDAAGTALGGEFQIHTSTAGDQKQPGIAMDAAGNFSAIWASDGTDGSGFGVYKQDFWADGTVNGGEVRANTSTSGDQGGIADESMAAGIGMNAQGDLVVVWSGNGTQVGQADADGVFMQRYGHLFVTTTADTVDGTTTSIAALLADKGADGQVSLREAMLAANATANIGGPDVIRFNIAGAGPHTITLSAILPDITDSVFIDGWSEPDFAGTPVIVLDGTNTVSRGLRIQDASGSTIRGLVIHRFTDDAITVRGAAAVGNVIVGNYIGTDVTGMLDLGNGGDGIDVRNGATNTVIGGTTAALRNVISGNTEEGVQVTVAGTNGTLIQGNYIGLNAAGTAALANDSFGVVIGTDVASATIGGTVPGAGNAISGNALANVSILNNATGVAVQGNIIGLNAAGTAAVVNGAEGVSISTGANTIGGSAPGARNVISGNATEGIRIYGSAGATFVQGNYIGTNAAGTAALGNGADGVHVMNSGNTIGGAAAAERNVISGNAGSGIHLLLGGADNNTIQGNYIGVNATATAVLGNLDHGILINVGPDGNAVTGNVIGGNANGGVRLIGDGGDNTTGNLIRGNWIGTDTTGTLDFGNLLEGVALQDGAAGNQIGGAAVGQGNVIAFNDTAGVAVYSGSVGTPILRNAIYSNGGLGIDLDNAFGTGATANDAGDADTGSNNLQNFPVLLYAQSNAGFTTVTGTLNSTASSTFTIHFYSSPSGDEAAAYLGSTTVTTDASGNAVINAGLAASVTAGHVITATATNAGNETSELSAAVSVAAGGLLVVDTTNDVLDGTITSLSALYGSRGADGLISLREALTAANNTANANVSTPDRIYFNIPGAGVHVITLASLLPDVNEAAVLDAATEPDFAGTPVLEIRGGGTVASAFNVQAGGAGSTIRGFVISGFSGDAINLYGGSNLIAGNYIGTNAAGTATAATPNAEASMRIHTGSDNNTIGGTTALDRNILAGNGTGGNPSDNQISLHGGGNLIIGNYVGVSADGTTVISSANDGIDVSTGATNNIVGGVNPGEGNLIAGQAGGGVRIQNAATGTLIRGNTIWGNGTGAAVMAGSGHLIQQNSIYGNTNLGIDLVGGTETNFVTANDAPGTWTGTDRDPDTGPNELKNFPVLTTVTTDGTSTITITGTLNGTGGRSYRIEFYSNPSADAPSGHGEGRTYLDFVNVTADASGVAPISATLSGVAVAVGSSITATTTDATSNATSEFAANIAAVASNAAPVLADTVVTLSPVSEDAGAPSGAVGTLANTLVGGASDADASALQGIAITAADATNGTWWYSTDNGSSWNAMGTPSTASARLLASDVGTRLYFQPNADYNGTLATAITFRAWDRTSGVNGGTADTSSNGGTTAFSSTTDTASLTVTAVNDAPTITNGASVGLTGTDEDSASSGTTVAAILTGAGWADVDGGALSGLAATAVSGSGTWQYSTDGLTWTAFGPVSGTAALLLDSGSQVRYVPDAQNGETATFAFRAWDQTSGSASVNGAPSTANPGAGGGSSAFSSQSASASIVVSAANDAPMLDNSGAMTLTGITEDDLTNSGDPISAIIASAGGDRITDVDSAAVEGIAVTALVGGNGTWEYSTDGGGSWNAVGAVSNNSALLLRANDRLRFVPDGLNADTPSLSFRAWDRSSGVEGTKVDVSSNGGTTAFSSAIETASLTVSAVNDAPVLADTPVTLNTVNEDAGAAVGAVGTLISALTGGIGDVDSGAVQGIAVTAADATNGSWWYSTDNGGSWNALGVPSGASARLLAADGSTRIYFQPAADYNGTIATALTFRAWDRSSGSNGALADATVNGGATAFSSATDTASLTVNAINDEPSFTLGGNQIVNEDAGAQTVAGFAAALPGGGADEMAQTFAYSVSNNNNPLFSVQPTIDASATLTYTPAANAFGSATVTVFVTDSGGTANGGDDTAPSQTFTITVNPVADAPVVVLPGAGLAYTEDQAGQVIDAGASVSDAEGNWNGGTLAVQITANAQAGDRLTILNAGGVSVAVNDTDVLVGATIVGTTPAATATGGNALTITFNAAATGADVQAVARAIGYYSSSQDPSTALRTVTFTATDAGALSGSATQTVTVTRVNDAPTLSATGLNPSFAQGAALPVNLFNSASASTIEAGQTFSQLVLTVSNLANGAAERLRIDGTLVGLTNGNSAITATNSYGVNVSVAGSTATVTITVTGASTAQLQTLVNGLAYHNNSGTPTGGPRVATMTSAQDSGGTAGGGADTRALAIGSTVTVTTSGAIPVGTDDAYSLNEEGTLTASGVSGWWDTSWQYRRQINIDNLGRNQLTDYPILVALNSSNIDYAQTQNQGQDLRFVDGNGTLLSHEIETWNESGTSYVWVRVPVVDANSNSDYITMYYGNVAAPDAQNANAVWNASYVGVWHLDEAGSGAANEFSDSSGTGNHGRGGAGAAAATPTQAAGRIGTGQNFDGVDDLISVANSASLQLTSAMTLEGWMRMDTFGVADVVDVLLRKGEDNPNNYQLSIGDQRPFYTLDEGENTGVIAPSTLNAGQWYHLTATFDGSTRRLYIDGVQVGSDAYSGPIGTDLRSLYIGGRTGTDFSDGIIDEARVSNTARSADWISAQYANVTNAGYLTFGAQQSATGGGVLFNDSDADGQPLTAVLVSGPANALAFTLNANGSFTYTPSANFAGTDTFTYRASDGTNNSNVATVIITVNPINDEPSFTLAANQTVAEDAGAQSVAGFATPAAGGGADEAGQTFSYTLSNSNNALFSVQPTIAANGTLSYAPTANAFGSATVTVFVTDSGGTAGGGDDTSPSQTFTITVTPVADTPSVTNATTSEDTQTTAGLVISRSAADGAEVTHFKITGIGGGTLYQNNGTTPINNDDFITFAQGSAGLRFTPSLNSTANGSFQVQASLSNNDAGLGGAVITATITVNPVNDAPVMTAGASTGYTENAAGVLIDTTVTVNDVDDTQIAGATVTISAGLTAGDVLGFTNTASISGSYNAGSGVLTLSGVDTLAAYQAALRSVTYSSTSEDPTALSASRSIAWQVTDANSDGTGAQTSTAVTSTVNVTALADAPVLTAGALTGYTENAAGVLIDTSVTVNDVDDTQIAGATVTISAGLTAGDVLGFTNTASISGSYNAGSGVLTLSGVDTLAAYQAALRSVTYSSTSEDPTASSASRTVGWQVTDANSDGAGAASSVAVTSTLNLTALADAPVLTAGAVTGYTENAAAVVIDGTITVNDVDDTQIAGATVTISAGLTAGDVLGFVNTASITGVYNAGSGVLTLSGTDTLANYQAALRSVTYSSTSEDPTASSASRTVGWQVTDADSEGLGPQSSAVVTSTVNLTALADAPVVTAGAVTGYTENAAAVAIDNTITVNDADDTQIAGATVSISAGLTAGDVLGFANTASISGSYNAGSGVLTLSGTDTLAAYQAALRSVTYSSTSEDPTATSASRTLAWQVTDANSDGAGAASSVVVTSTLNLTALADVPVLTAGAVTGYTENAAAVLIDTTVTVTDADDAQIAGATVTIGAGLTAGDVLGFTNTASISGVYNPGTGVLSLSGVDTLAAYQAALRSVTYSSTSEDPTATSASRSIAWQVTDANSDGTGAASSTATGSMLNVTAVNDAPVLGANRLTILQGDSVILGGVELSASDVDDPAGSLTYAISNLSNGRFELIGAPGVAIGGFTAAQLSAGQVRFVHDGSPLAPAYSISVSDGFLSDGPLPAAILFNALPVITPPPPPPPVTINPPPAEPPPASEPEAAAERQPVRTARAVFSPGRIESAAAEAQLNVLEGGSRGAPARPYQPVATLNTFEAGPRIDPTLELLAAAPANLQYLPSVPLDWTTQPAFSDDEEPVDRIQVLLEQAQLGGIALSVGVVWWASRISGLLGSLLASAPAWRHIDPLPVVGRDEDEDKKWYDANDRDADANELAIDGVLEGARAAGAERPA